MSLPQEGFLRLRQIIGDIRRGIPALIPVSRSTWYAGVASGRFPKPVHLGARTVAWRIIDIRALMDRLAARPREKLVVRRMRPAPKPKKSLR